MRAWWIVVDRRLRRAVPAGGRGTSSRAGLTRARLTPAGGAVLLAVVGLGAGWSSAAAAAPVPTVSSVPVSSVPTSSAPTSTAPTVTPTSSGPAATPTSATPTGSTPTRTPTWTGSMPTPTITRLCPDYPPVTGSLVSVTSTSLTFAFQAPNQPPPPGCGAATTTYVTVVTVSPGGTREVVARVHSAVGATSGTLTVTGLMPDTAYEYSFAGGGSPFASPVQGPIRTRPLTSTPTPSGTPLCPDYPPVTGAFVSATATSLTFSFVAPNPNPRPGCSIGTATTVTVLGVAPDGSRFVVTRVTGQSGVASGTLTATGLAPDSTYYFGFSGGGSPFGSPTYGPVRTLPGTQAPPCSARLMMVSQWPGGFFAQVTVTNSTTVPLSGWRVSWAWTGGERLVDAYNVTVGGTPTAPSLTPKDWNRTIQPGGSVSFHLIGASTGSAAVPIVSCASTASLS